MPFVRWCRLEAKTSIKGLGSFVKGVCQQSPDARLISNRNRSADSVLQHAKTNTLPLVVDTYGKPRQNDQRNLVLPHPAANPIGSIERVDLANGQAEIPGDTVPIANDERSRRNAALSLACVAQ